MDALTFFLAHLSLCVFFLPSLQGFEQWGKFLRLLKMRLLLTLHNCSLTLSPPQPSPQVLVELVMQGTVGHWALYQDLVCEEGVIYTPLPTSSCSVAASGC